jgi:hypothetical protein
MLTNDTDLVEPLRPVTQEIGLAVVLLTPGKRPSLVSVSTCVRHNKLIWGASSTPAEIYSKRPSERLLRVIFHRKTAKKGI